MTRDILSTFTRLNSELLLHLWLLSITHYSVTQYPLCVLKHSFISFIVRKKLKFTDEEKHLSRVRGDCMCLNVNKCAVANAPRISVSQVT